MLVTGCTEDAVEQMQQRTFVTVSDKGGVQNSFRSRALGQTESVGDLKN